MRGFAPTLPFFTQLEILDVSYNNLSDEDVKLLAKCLSAPFLRFVIRQPLTDEQELSVSFACMSLRPWLCQAAPSTIHNHSSNKRMPSLELRVQVSGMLQEHTGWKAEVFPHTVEASSCAGDIISTLLIKVHFS